MADDDKKPTMNERAPFTGYGEAHRTKLMLAAQDEGRNPIRSARSVRRNLKRLERQEKRV